MNWESFLLIPFLLVLVLISEKYQPRGENRSEISTSWTTERTNWIHWTRQSKVESSTFELILHVLIVLRKFLDNLKILATLSCFFFSTSLTQTAKTENGKAGKNCAYFSINRTAINKVIHKTFLKYNYCNN
jgi:hypothetical protein